MSINEEEIKETFLAELRDNITALNEILIKLEMEPTNLDLVEKIMRIAHTLKGMSATMNYDSITKLCHEVENLLEKVSKGGMIDSVVLNFLFKVVDKLEDLARMIGAGQGIEGIVVEEILNQMTSVDDFMVTLGQKFQAVIKFSKDCKLRGPRSLVVLNNLEKIANIIKTDPVTSEIDKGNIFGDLTVEFVTSEDEAVIAESIKAVQDVDSVELSLLTEGISPTLAAEQVALTALTVRISLRDLDQLMNLVGELVIANGILEEMLQETGSMDIVETISKVKGNVLTMQDIITNMRMVSVDHAFGRFPRMIRDIASDQNKEIEFITRGGYTQVDRTLIEHLHEPLVHLIRNAASHGIETRDVRQAQGKRPRGTIILTATQEQNDVIITVEDDGQGIDLTAIKTAAVANNLIPKGAPISQERLLDLIFSSRFSTSKDVSEVSGRGLGMTIAWEKVELAGGTISVTTVPKKGTTITMRFPLITPISRALLAAVNGMLLALPLTNISQILTVGDDQILKTNGHTSIVLREKKIPILDLRQTLIPSMMASDVKGGSAVIWEKGPISVALLIDQVKGIEDVVFKKPDTVMSNIQGISGATIISGGDIALILDPLPLIEESGTADLLQPEMDDKEKQPSKAKSKTESKEKPKQTPKPKPKEQPKEKPKETPKSKPKDQPKEKPKETPKSKPKDQPKEKSKETPKSKSTKTPKPKPKHTPEAKPKETPEAKPKETPEAKPKETPEAKSKETTKAESKNEGSKQEKKTRRLLRRSK